MALVLKLVSFLYRTFFLLAFDPPSLYDLKSMDLLEKIALTMSIGFIITLALIIKHFYQKVLMMKSELEMLKMKVKAYEIYEKMESRSIDDLVNDRNSKRNKT